ncbi:hypothetical protein EX895_005927 [Sporisorium graminicola]|uniref:RING-type domain-containing protein n=1 Tax=Sporisorium graminicola TaxID=280036 RepID=A0A4U7KM43_9BASI|nr:hypothetical protein EX895_005927 [Sporisorium graminicola]TKY84847.1 hypothetical protein EX895_005927 [Sporisorium graminicola]
MKFGKTYMETMADPAFPEEWRNGALEYKHLKKLINGVVAELESIGLGADVLRELLIRPEDEANGSPHDSPKHKTNPLPANVGGSDSALADDSGNSSEQEDQHGAPKKLTPAGKWVSDFSVDMIRRASTPGKSVAVTNAKATETAEAPPASSSSASQQLPANSDVLNVPSSPKPRRYSHGVEAVSSSMDDLYLHSETRGRASFSAGHPPDATKWAGLGRKDLAAMGLSKRPSDGNAAAAPSRSYDPSPGRHDWNASKWREEAKLDWDPSSNTTRNPRTTLSLPNTSRNDKSASPARHRWVEGKYGRRARAEYELGGTPEHPVPRIRLYIESPLPSDDEGDDDEDADNSEAASLSDDASSRKSLEEQIIELPTTPTRRFSTIPEDGPEGETREQKVKRQSEIRRKRGTRSREVVIPLTADTQFLDTLTHALQNLSNIQTHQRDNFVLETESLCSAIARASSPFASKNDLYVWREIFGLWVDMQVFESQREKDRGELSIDESEARLKRFALELAKRGWIHDPDAPAPSKKGRLVKLKLGSGPSSQGLKNQASATAIEDFLRLNFALLDVKKFQRVNVEAARKILKKHDKRTALTASNDLRAFMAQQEAARRAMGIHPVGSGGVINLPASAFQPAADVSNGNSTALVSSAAHPSLAALLPSATTGILSESLPHILLSLVTTTLLPILPAVDDYSCAICTSVAWRPVRLDCSHLFCLRCLVKLQRQGKDDCPLCRAPSVVKTADRRNMDEDADKYLQTWFPREVKEKSKDNEKDRRQEDLEALGLREEKCVIQ